MTQLEPGDQPDAQILILRDPQTGEIGAVAEPTDEQVENATLSAKERRAIWEHRKEGAELRAGSLPRRMTNALAHGTVNLMFSRLLQEELVPKTAKEAAEVAKIAYDIAQRTGGTADPKDMSAPERAQKEKDVMALAETLEARSRAKNADLGGALPPGERPVVPDDDEPDEWEDDDEVRDRPED